MSSKHSEITPEIIKLADKCYEKSIIDNELFVQYDVKRGLRDLNGRGVLTGLTHISDVRANKIVDGEQIPLPGELFYRGYNVKDLVRGFSDDNRFGFEEIASSFANYGFCSRYHYESSEQGYDEYSCAKCSYFIFL